MPTASSIKPTNKARRTYYAALEAYRDQGVTHEGALETAFQQLLADTAKPHRWFLVPKQTIRVRGKHAIPEGTLRDEYNPLRGYWEAKVTGDDLAVEIRKKADKGYPLTNTIFEDTRRAVLYQNGVPTFKADLTEPQQCTG